MRKAICKYCGEEFEYSNRGKERVHCKKAECLRKGKNEAQRKWYANKMKVLKGTKNRIVERKEGKKVIYSSVEKIDNRIKNEDFSRVIELARKLGAVRFEILEELNKCSPEQSKCDKADEVFLHNIEDLLKKDVIYDTDVVEIVKKHINNRPNRRFVKDKQAMLQRLISGIISNPNEYVIQFIKNRDKRTYTPEKKGHKNGTNKGQ